MLKSLLLFFLLPSSLFAIMMPQEELNFTTSRYEFAIDIFNHLSSSKFRDNFLISPASVQTAMTLLYMGSADSTEVELRNGLHLERFQYKEIVSDDYAKFLNMATRNGTYELKIANRIYVRKDLKVQNEFNELASKYFHSGIECVDFRQSAETAKIINDWIKLQTHNKISKITDSSDLDRDTQMMLLNAIYFKARWVYPFNISMTANFEFSVTPRKKSMVTTMTRSSTEVRHVTFSDLAASAIELPYSNSDLRMLIFKPNNVLGLRKLERNFKMEHLMAFPKTLRPQIVNIRLPKFRVEYTAKLSENLKRMGFQETFDPNLSDFSKIFQDNATVALSDVVHKTFIHVTEVGTEAAAATSIHVNRFIGMLPIDKPIDFYVNHPFLFVISDEHAVYWIGHVVNL